jgi:hypothetical protein
MESAHLPINANDGCRTHGSIADKGHAVDETQIAPSPLDRDIAAGMRIPKVSIPATAARILLTLDLLRMTCSVQFSCAARKSQHSDGRRS